LNKDDIYFYYIEDENKIDITIMSLKRKLLNETQCVICIEKCINNYYSCSQCGNFIHIHCFEKCIVKKCPVCSNDKFLHYK